MRVPLAPLAAFAVSVCGSAAAAQELCGVPTGTVEWAGDGPLASDVATAGPFDKFTVVAGLERSVFAFVSSGPGELRLEALPEGSGDPFVRLLSDTGDVLGEDDDSGGGLASRLEIGAAAGGYCLEVENLQDQPMTVSLRVGRTEDLALTEDAAGAPAGGGGLPDQCPADAVPLALSAADLAAGPVVATGSAAEQPFYLLQLADPVPLTLTLENEDADPTMTLLDASGEFLAENDDSDGLNSRIDIPAALAAGEYCLSVSAISDETLPMTLTVAMLDPEELMRRRFDAGELSPPLDGSHPVTDLGALGTDLSHDLIAGQAVVWFTVELAEPSLVVFDAIGVEVDVTLKLFDAVGRPVAENDDGPVGTDSRIAERLQPGLYVVGVGTLGDVTGGAARLTMERFVRAE